jgi:hypothetical protein
MKWVGKTRTVRVATPEGDRVYRSIEAVPPRLREILRQTLEGPNAETILIANQEAYERLNQQLIDLPARIENAPSDPERQPAPDRGRRIWIWGVGGALGAGLALWSIWFWLIRNGT